MRQVILSDLARADLVNIGEYIAQRNPDVMERFRREVQPAGSIPSFGAGTQRHSSWFALPHRQ